MQATKPSLASSHVGNVIPGQQVHFAKLPDKKAAPSAVPPQVEPPPPAPTYHHPQITLIKEGDTVHGIEVICTCGEVIRLDCKYVEAQG